MDKNYVDEDPFALFKRAEEDVAGVNALLKQKDVPEEYNYVLICYHATQAAEKFLKGFIIENKGLIRKTHNLEYIQNVAENIDANFSIIKKECIILNGYTQGARYNDSHTIEKDEISNVLNALNKIYHFEPIAKMRGEYKKKNNYRILPEFDFFKKRCSTAKN